MKILEFISNRNAVMSSVQSVRVFSGIDYMCMNHFTTDRGTQCAAYICFQLSTFDGDMKDIFSFKENPLKLFYAVSPISMSVFFGNDMKIFKEHKEGERNTFFKKGEIKDINDFVNYSNELIKCSMCSREMSASMSKYYPYETDEMTHCSLSFEVDKERESKLFKLVDFMKDMTIEGVMRKMKPYEKHITEMMSSDKYVNGSVTSKERQLYWMINDMPIKVNLKKDGGIVIYYRKDANVNAKMFFKYEKNFSIDTDNVSKGFFGFICQTNVVDRCKTFINDKGEPMSDEEKKEEVLKMLDEVFKAYSL